MKIYISLPLNFEIENNSEFSDAINHLTALGHNITGLNTKQKNFSESEKELKDADIIISEISNLDSKVGYEIAKSFSEKKLVIALENEKSKNAQNPIIKENLSKNLIHKKYSDKNIVTVIDSTLKEAAKKIDSKFILIISPEIDRYLDWTSNTKRMHKAQIVRNALETTMKKDKDYQKFLKD